ncbi:MAG: flagellar export protein FliJ [Gammaproteobacteria bacterium]|nr:flagellar export protein FliJ [Gammaproteobacteria bacterium]
MVASKRFKPVQRIAENRERTAAREFGVSQKNLKLQEEKLSELKNYHREYLERFQSMAREGISASQLHEYRAFICKLETAIKAQEETLHSSRVHCSEQKEMWKEKHSRTRVLGKVVERFQNAEHRERENREQKEQDEHSQRSNSNTD